MNLHDLIEAHGRNVGTREFIRVLAWPKVQIIYKIHAEGSPHPDAVAMCDTPQGKVVLCVGDNGAEMRYYRDEPTEQIQSEAKVETDPLFGLFQLVCNFLEMSEACDGH